MMMAKMIMIMKGYTVMNSIIITENACRHAEKVRDKHAYILALHYTILLYYRVFQAICNIKNQNISAASAAMVLLKTDLEST